MGAFSRNLHLKIVFLFVVAILPAATLAALLATANYREAKTFKDSALMQSAQLVAAREGALIESIRRVLLTLAAQESIRAGQQPRCSEALAAAVQANTIYAAIALRDGDGRFTCFTGRSGGLDTQANSEWIKTLAERAFGGSQFALAANTLEERQTIAAAVPIEGTPNTLVMFVTPGFLGSSAVSVPYLRDATAALLTSGGQPISLYFSRGGIDWLPREVPFEAGSDARLSRTGTGTGRDGTVYRYASVPISETDLSVLSATPLDLLYRGDREQYFTALAFPIALLLLSVATAWVAVDRLVLRWVAHLRETAAIYGAGEFGARAKTPRAMPTEIKELADTFNAMAGNVQERSDQLERALEAKSQLLRELHHRVKNNFQVIASLLALQKRSLGSHDRAVLRYSEDRVQAMATAYRVSYASGEIGNVGVSKLVQEILTYLRQSSEAAAHLVRAEVATGGIEVDLDTAIPLSLLLIDIMTPLADQARRVDQPARINVSIDPASSDLIIVAKGPAASEAEPASELSGKLGRAFVQQIEGRLESEASGTSRTARITVPARRLIPAGGASMQAAD